MRSKYLDDIRHELATAPAPRLPLPFAYSDPAFTRCIEEAANTPELIAEFDRLYGCRVGTIANLSPIERMVDKATGFQDDQMRQFVQFIHDAIYLRAPDEAINAFRLTASLDQCD